MLAKDFSAFHKFFFFLLGFLLIVLPIMPIDLTPKSTAYPNILLCYIFSFVIINPKNAPFFLIVLLNLIADFLWFRPLGLMTLLTLVITEFVRWRLKNNIYINYKLEQVYFFLLFSGIILFELLMSGVGLIPSFNFKLIASYYLTTVISYPIVSLLARLVFKSKRTTNKMFI